MDNSIGGEEVRKLVENMHRVSEFYHRLTHSF